MTLVSSLTHCESLDAFLRLDLRIVVTKFFEQPAGKETFDRGLVPQIALSAENVLFDTRHVDIPPVAPTADILSLAQTMQAVFWGTFHPFLPSNPSD